MALKLDFSEYKSRRENLIKTIQETHQDIKAGVVVLCANFEGDDTFVQESSFYYFTGLNEPGAVCILDLDGSQQLYIPNCGDEREKWVNSAVVLNQTNAKQLGFDDITVLGERCQRYQIYPFSPKEQYGLFIKRLQDYIQMGAKIFTTMPDAPYGYLHQRLLLSRLIQWTPGLESHIRDCSDIIAQMRRNKSNREIELIFKAIQITAEAQEAAAKAIADGAYEADVQAALEYIMTTSNAQKAFPSIVGSGLNSTVLHYGQNDQIMQKGDLVVVDIGASYKHYAADITRTYPVSGVFTDRQKEVYTIVLEVQEYIVDIAQPGYYLRNNDCPEKSLHHLAMKFLEERGYAQYMPHGLGHYMGLDVHDVGDYKIPLKAGDVFTIEPGIYIPQEEIGIRIEDDYWMTEKGIICLSEDIPKDIKEIEKRVAKKVK